MILYDPYGKYISRMFWLLQSRLDGELQKHGIRITQYSILRYLYLRDQCSQEQIASDLKIDKALCSRETRKLEEAGYLTRVRDDEDNRRNVVRLTPKALSLQQDLVRIGDIIHETTLAGFSSEEREILYSLTSRIIENLEVK